MKEMKRCKETNFKEQNQSAELEIRIRILFQELLNKNER
jgi:hypothetical protein